MSNAIYHLSRLSFNQIEWITELKNKLCQNGIISDEDIQIAFEKINSTKTLSDFLYQITSTPSVENTQSLYRFYENVNLEGLYDGKEIVFSPELTIIYGKNGSGKTSFFKALKDAFYKPQKIKGNIYTPSTNPISAKFDFVKKEKHLVFQKKGTSTNFPGSELQTFNWNVGNQINSNLKFCDREILDSSLHKKDTGWSIDRYKLGYYDLLRDAVDKVSMKVALKIAEINGDYNANLQSLLNGLKSDKDEGIKKNIQNNLTDVRVLKSSFTLFSNYILEDGHADKKINIQKRATISVKELNDKIQAQKAKQVILKNIQSITAEKTHICIELNQIKNKVARIKKLKNSLDFSKLEQYQLIFEPSKNNQAFIELFKKITETALVFGYENYPEEVDKCFYCNQNLPETNKSLIKEIHSLIDNEINSEIDELEKVLEAFRKRINAVIEKETPIYEYNSIGDIYECLSNEKIELSNLHEQAFDCTTLSMIEVEIKELKNSISSIDSVWTNNDCLFDIAQSEEKIIQIQINQLEKQLLDIEKNKKKALEELNSLEDVEFCVSQKALLLSLLTLLSESSKYNLVSNNFTNIKSKISRDKGRVETELIRQNYLETFNSNLDFFELPRRERFSRPFSNPSGQSKVEAKIQVDSNTFEVSEILSEGEAKVYSFCDWLTELEYDDNKILVFDDPVNSLDQVNIYKVVDKIITLSKTYQVIVFTHHFEFYHRLIQKSLGGSPLKKGKCELCKNDTESNQCTGLNTTTNVTHKCGKYYMIEHILRPGQVVEDVMFLTLDWEQRIEVLRRNLLNGDIREADKHLRTSINNFFERYVMNDIKRQVYKNNDLIKEWRGFKQVHIDDYDILMDVHNKISGESTIHEPSPEVRTPLDVQGFILEFNKTVRAINNIRSFENPSPPRNVAEITF
ncbi:hypothetical protein DFQ09_102465 [Winogradskyella pacifica]|uniref:Uncharacterized protein n=1 Tax=Winogradskyella pacifica TaxID=664642 RepID=A0A3D9N4I0_9FLAO|nr:AAA family ATPase [Winogradskyella pacifica]REE25874.1 hypothetical protein DFQ09_102465 [Winogradskyella pacifica]